MDRKFDVLAKILQTFGAGLVRSGILKPAGAAVREVGEAVPRAASTAVREGSELIENIAKRGIGLLGERPPAVTRAPSALPQSVRGFIPEVGAPRPRVSGAATPSPVSPELNPFVQQLTRGRVNRPVGYEGKQLDMFSGMNRLTYPAGTKTAEGFAVGGRTFNPADVMPEGQYTQRIRELARSKGVPEELFMEQMLRPGKSLADEVNLADIPAQTGLFAKAPEFGTYQVRNLIRQNVGNLSELVKANPRLAAALGVGAVGAGAIGTGLSQMGPSAPSAPVLPSPMGPTTANADAGVTSDPQSKTPAQIVAESMTSGPGVAAQLEAPVYRGAERTAYATAGDADENLRAAKQQYIKPEGALQKYYKQREAYANYPAHKTMIISELQKQGVLDTPELMTWAGANPELAYELYRKLPNQQSMQQKEVVTTSPIGTNIEKAAIGNSVNQALSLVEGQVGASDLVGVTTANTNLKLNPMPTDIVGYIQRAALLR